MAATQGTKLIAAVVPPDTQDSFPTHKAEYGKGGIHHVQSESDLQNIPDARLVEYQLATVAGRDGLLFQLDDKAAGTWSVIDLGGNFKVVSTNTERDSISSDQKTDGMIVAVTDPDDDSNKEYKTYQLRGGSWQEVEILSPSELDNAITSNSEVDSNTDARHTHSNKSVLDSISSSGRGSVITSTEAGKLHEHSNKSVLDSITGAGSGDIITSAERGDIHSHANKSVLDQISNVGSGDIITSSERTSLNNNTDARHSHSNKSTLDNIQEAGSGNIITQQERNSIDPAQVLKTSDFTVDTNDDSKVFRLDPNAGGGVITVTFDNDGLGFGNSFWCAFLAVTANYEIKFQAVSSANIFFPGSEGKIVERFAWVMAYHINSSGTSNWYLEGRLA